MEQLLSIKPVPIAVEIVINNAKISYDSKLPKVEISRKAGGLQMKAEPMKIKIDTFEMRQSIGMKSNSTLTKEFANEGIKVSYQAIARIAEEGDSLASPKGMSVSEIAASRIHRSIETVMDFLPKEGPDISWDGGKLSIHYQMDEIEADWDIGAITNFEFVPGKIELEVKQRPTVDIEYIGGPIYVPPSAAPDYQGNVIDIKA